MVDTSRNPDSPTSRDSHHVSVAEAKAYFNHLQRVLSSRLLSRSPDDSEKDVEQAEEPEVFDLRAYLTSASEAAQQAGVFHKHVGVTWENLRVDGVGDAGHKVRHTLIAKHWNFLTASTTPHHIVDAVDLRPHSWKYVP